MSLVNESIDEPASSTNTFISAADITTCINVLSQFNSKKSNLSIESSEFDSLRPLIHNLFHLEKRRKKAQTRDATLKIKRIDRKAKDTCLLRSGRAGKLQRLQLQTTLVPDGVVDIDSTTTQPLPLEGRTFPSSSSAPERLLHPISCYICKLKYRTLHFFYDRLCPACAKFNFEKRLQTVNLSNRIALVTGGRIKIGYRIVLKLLRANCFVITTTRFPIDFLRRLSSERDFETWKDRVHIYGVDFRYSQLVEHFAQMIIEKYDRLDFLINNACQTIQRPNEFYQHLIGNERIANYSLLPDDHQSIVNGNMLFYKRLSPFLDRLRNSSSSSSSLFPLSLTYDHESIETSPSTINNIVFDVNQQPIDRRSTNSWTLRLGDLSTMEINEVLTINTLAPFILNSQLKVLMANKHPEPESKKFIINVSAMEGSFSRRNKTDRHPHTNAAKAALNMMTRTSADDYKKSNIYMVSVDTGWINDEKPLEQAYKSMIRLDFQTPLDEEDAAARVLDPIIDTYRQLADGKVDIHIPYGCFLKDYHVCNW